MSAKIVTVSREVPFIWDPGELERLWFFPDGSEYLRYSPHFHAIHRGGFRQNFPLIHMFVVVLAGKLSIKDYSGFTVRKIEVRDQVWFVKGSDVRAQGDYATTIPGRAYVRRPNPITPSPPKWWR